MSASSRPQIGSYMRAPKLKHIARAADCGLMLIRLSPVNFAGRRREKETRDNEKDVSPAIWLMQQRRRAFANSSPGQHPGLRPFSAHRTLKEFASAHGLDKRSAAAVTLF